MVTKEELSDKLNEILQTEVDFSKMTKEDLESLLKILQDPVNLIQLGLKSVRKRAQKEILNRPLKDLVDGNSIFGELTEKPGGPLGFGILPRIFGKKHENKEKTKT